MGMKGDEEEVPEVEVTSEGCSKGRLVPAMVLTKAFVRG